MIGRLLSRLTGGRALATEPLEVPSYREQLDARERRLLEEHASCYVCELPLDTPEDAPVGATFKCPRCGITNELVQGGRLIRPERLAIYHKYEGDPYDKGSRGLVGELEERFAAEFEPTRAAKQSGAISEKEYRSLYGKWYRRKEKALAALYAQKETELRPLRTEEKRLRAQLLSGS